MPTYVVALLGKYLCYALLALALDLVWGYCGILSLGHGAFFALGGYAMGMYLMRQIGTRGVYGNPVLPDFMVFLNWKELPWFWHGFDNFWFACLMVVLVPGLLAFVFGWFAFRSRVTGVYLSIITQAMTYALLLAFFRNDMGFGGNNGLTDFKDILGFNVQADATRAALFAASALALALAVSSSAAPSSARSSARCWSRCATPRAARASSATGSRAYKLFVFVVSAVMAGIAGALYVPQVGIINPGEFAPANSIEVVIWVAVGGRGTLIGPIIGAHRRQFRQDAGSPARCRNLAVRAGRAVHRRHAVPAQGHCRHAVRTGSRTEPRQRRNAGADAEPAAGGRATPAHGHDRKPRHAPLSRRRHRLLRRLQGAQQSVAASSTAARCARSSAPTAPARPR